jgi:deazaflavin-dependent oxidoreductase (nitroreductase family)
MTYLKEGEVYHVFGSKAGADVHPDWYHNLVANPGVTVEVLGDTFEATATVLDRPERDRVYAEQVKLAPGFGTYQEGTKRIIPVVALTRTA